MMKSYKFKIEPNRVQRERIETTLNLCRWLYNTALEQRNFSYEKRGISVNYNMQQNELPRLKQEFPEFKQVQSQVLQDILRRLDKAFKGFFRRIKAGEKAGYPRFQGKNRYDSFTYPQSGFSLDGKYLKLSKIGNVRIKCHRQVEGKIKTCTIIRKNGKYYACFSCEIETITHSTGKQVGVDLGVRHLAITSDGEFFEHPKYFRKSERKLKRLQRIVSKRKKGSNRRRKAVALLAKLHEYIANQRKDIAHKISRYLVDRYDLIAFEDLNIKGMVLNHKLAKSIVDAGWNQLVQFTSYKAEYAGKQVIQVDPYNTSQACSKCGQIVKKERKDRVHSCSCGYTEDRDVNAARNILHKAVGHVPTLKCGQLELNLI
ncbi:RNA-guided endonuclease InsQ/TnpB family protein [Risungbinella massiliensis]|uniref:RNA-guided endonuclease InsQ/TnpB family protein n=1 Tax=Risungbinella massiliensis TaxID=1329796 RepID=UPI0005CC8962|nr:RNA-guided endonuclease TnpB family protein [Risungbinella massiliensis]